MVVSGKKGGGSVAVRIFFSPNGGSLVRKKNNIIQGCRRRQLVNGTVCDVHHRIDSHAPSPRTFFRPFPPFSPILTRPSSERAHELLRQWRWTAEWRNTRRSVSGLWRAGPTARPRRHLYPFADETTARPIRDPPPPLPTHRPARFDRATSSGGFHRNSQFHILHRPPVPPRHPRRHRFQCQGYRGARAVLSAKVVHIGRRRAPSEHHLTAIRSHTYYILAVYPSRRPPGTRSLAARARSRPPRIPLLFVRKFARSLPPPPRDRLRTPYNYVSYNILLYVNIIRLRICCTCLYTTIHPYICYNNAYGLQSDFISFFKSTNIFYCCVIVEVFIYSTHIYRSWAEHFLLKISTYWNRFERRRHVPEKYGAHLPLNVT